MYHFLAICYLQDFICFKIFNALNVLKQEIFNESTPRLIQSISCNVNMFVYWCVCVICQPSGKHFPLRNKK